MSKTGEIAGRLGPEEDLVVDVCGECIEARHRAFQAAFTEDVKRGIPRLLAAGKMVNVKAPFSDPDPGATVEHMWVEVRHVDFANRLVGGILVNYPGSVRALRAWQWVDVAFGDISDMHVFDSRTGNA